MLVDTEAVLAKRSEHTHERIAHLREEIESGLTPDERLRVFGDHTSIYATGSMGRLELSSRSDLDAFILRNHDDVATKEVDAWLIQSAVLRASRKLKFPEPDGDGRFLRMHSLSELLQNLGTIKDDASNTFTARMLLLLESRALSGDEAHADAIDKVVRTYWRNSDENPTNYRPMVLVNDIIRYWRILLLNYEAKNSKEAAASRNDRSENERRLRSYKLRFSRCLLCYSAIAALLHESRKGNDHVTFDNAVRLLKQTPLERLKCIEEDAAGDERNIAKNLREFYATFLSVTDRARAELVADFGDLAYRTERSKEARAFGENVFKLLQKLGEDNPLYRFVVV